MKFFSLGVNWSGPMTTATTNYKFYKALRRFHGPWCKQPLIVCRELHSFLVPKGDAHLEISRVSVNVDTPHDEQFIPNICQNTQPSSCGSKVTNYYKLAHHLIDNQGWKKHPTFSSWCIGCLVLMQKTWFLQIKPWIYSNTWHLAIGIIIDGHWTLYPVISTYL